MLDLSLRSVWARRVAKQTIRRLIEKKGGIDAYKGTKKVGRESSGPSAVECEMRRCSEAMKIVARWRCVIASKSAAIQPRARRA